GYESDHWRGLPTDDHLASSGETWVDSSGCQVSGVCAEGQRAFRYARVLLRRGTVEIRAAGVRLPPSVRNAAGYDGWFLSSDDLLNRIWYASVYTDELVTEELPPVARVLDTWYPGFLGADGLLADPFGCTDYAYIERGGQTIAYDNALYALALRNGAALASWLGQSTDWSARAEALGRRVDGAFWDGTAYRDATTGPAVHAQDGNALAVLAGAAPPDRARAALAYLATALARRWGH